MNAKGHFVLIFISSLLICKNIHCKNNLRKIESEHILKDNYITKNVVRINNPKRKLIFGVLAPLLAPVVSPILKGIGNALGGSNSEPPPQPPIPSADSIIAGVSDSLAKKMLDKEKESSDDEDDEESEDEDDDSEDEDDSDED